MPKLSLPSIAVTLLLTATAAVGQDSVYGSADYGGGWAVPSLDTASMVGQQVLANEAGLRAAGRGSGAPRLGSASGGATVAASSLFANALTPGEAPVARVETRFQRSPTMQRQSEAAILSEIARRQPGAEAEYARVFRQHDMAALFDRATAGYGLRNNDIADTMAAYWLVSWVIANGANDFSPAAARAVRDQVRAGIARTPVANYSPAKKHRLADEAIFNTLVATQAFEYAQQGKISRADYVRIGNATQKAFLGFGADLRALRLTENGFQKGR